MFWLIWQMGVLLVIFFGLGLLVGYLVWSGDARSAEADKAIGDNKRLREENENLARRLGEASSRSEPTAEAAPQVAPATPAPPEPDAGSASGGGAAAEPKPASKPKPAPKPKPAAKAEAAPKSRSASESKSKPAPAKPKAAAKPKADDKPAASGGDDLTRIKGLGPKAEAALKAGGVTTIAQIAAWNESEAEAWDDRINGRGRIARDKWVEQAKEIAG